MMYFLNRLQGILCQVLLAYIVVVNPTEASITSDWDSQDFGRVRLISGVSGLGNGIDIDLGLEFQLQPGWKIYWRSPGDAGSPPVLKTSDSSNLRAVEMKWPWPQRFDEGAGLTTVGYLGQTVFPILVEAQNESQPLYLRVAIDYQACEIICIPVSAYAELLIPPGIKEQTRHASLIKEFKRKVPVHSQKPHFAIASNYYPDTNEDGVLTIRLTSDESFVRPSIFVESQNSYRFGREDMSLTNASRTATFVVPVSNVRGEILEESKILVTLVDKSHAIEFWHRIGKVEQGKFNKNYATLGIILATALLGGLILNLMPCVLPVLSIKLLSVLNNMGGNSWKVRVSFLASVAGIISSYLLLALGTIAFQTAGQTVGWGMQFQEPVFLVFLTIILTLFSCNLLGFLEVRSLSLGFISGNSNHNRSGKKWITDSFLTGAFATLLATPCSAPFVGTSVSFALSRGTFEIIAIFCTLGLGMAIPYLIFAIKPNLVTRLPRPGNWMIHLRTILGFSLIATAVWLLFILSNQTNIFLAVVIGATMLVCSFLLKTSARISGKRKSFLHALVLILAGSSLSVSVFPDSLPNLKRQPITTISDGSGWIDFNPDKIPELVSAGKIVFVDITADWCLTCKINQKLVLERSQIINQLAAPDVVRMRGDWTKRDPQIQAYLISFSRFGIPFNAVYSSTAPNGILLPELLTRKGVLSALELASNINEFN